MKPFVPFLFLLISLGTSTVWSQSSEIYLKVVGDTVNLRESVGKSAKVLKTISFGEKLLLLKVSDTIERINDVQAPWIQVRTLEGTTGYVFGSLLQVLSTGGAPPPYIDYLARPKIYKSKTELLKTPKERRYSYVRHWFKPKEYQFLLEKGFSITTPAANAFVNVDDMIDNYIPYSYIRKTEEVIQTYDASVSDYRVLPMFISSDYLLHCFHLVFDRMLEDIEQEKLQPALKELSTLVYQSLLNSYLNESDPKLKTARFHTLAFAAVPLALLSVSRDEENEDAPPNITFIKDASVRKAVEKELSFIYKMSGPTQNSITGGKVDYSQFTVRGHYTHSSILKSYFRAMIWYGQMYFPIKERALEGILIAESFRNPKIVKAWDRVNALVETLIGRSDDQGPKDYLAASESVFGKEKTITKLPNTNELESFIQNITEQSKRKIVDSPLRNQDGSFTPEVSLEGFRFMGQRFIMDSRIFTLLTSPRVGDDKNPRNFPKGLDLFAAYGSPMAESLLQEEFDTIYKFKEQFQKVRKELKSKNGGTPTLYEAWIGLLVYHLTAKDKVNQPFNQTNDWQIRKLLTTHGSWAELRHDTILYAKPSAAEMGGPDGEEVWIGGAPLIPRGYVEPDPEFFQKLGSLLTLLKESAAKENLLTDAYRRKIDLFLEITKRVTEIAKKEVSGKAFSDEDAIYLGDLNQSLASIVIPAGTYADAMTSEEKQMALVADIHTDGMSGSILHVGVGSPKRIWIYVKDASGERICEGMVFSYYEFPESKRMTDEEWKAKVYNQEFTKELKSKEPKWLQSLPLAD